MTPFQQFRFWARRAPIAQRLSAGAGAVLVVAVLAWLVVPTSHNAASSKVSTGAGRTSSATAGAAAGNPTASSGAAGGTQSAGGAASGAPSAGAANTAQPGGAAAPVAGSSGGAGCVPPSGSDQGVTDSEIKIGVILIQAIGPTANEAFGVPPPAEQQKNYEQVIDDVNASGGVACRKLVAQFFTPNAVDQSSLQQACLDIAQAGVFAVVDDGGYTAYPQLAKCFPEAQLPTWAAYAIPQKLQEQYYPYLFSGSGVVDVVQRNFVFALNQQGWFGAGNGFKKLGVLYRDCSPEFFPQFVDYLHQIGLQDGQIRSYNFGCSGATPFGNPSDISQAVQDFKINGVTHVTFLDDNPDFGPFTNVADAQGFRPKYGLSDQNTIGSANSSTSNYNANNIDGALGITSTRYGEPDTPGLTKNDGTAKCDAIYASQGRPSSSQNQGVPGVACSEIWALAASINHAPALQRDALAAGLQAVGSIDWSYPYGPADFTGQQTTTGGQFWRTVQFSAGCRCWQVAGDPTFQSSFP